MNFNEVERVIVDLGILGQLRRNSKVSVVEPEYLTIQDHIPVITPFMRWLYGDKRGSSISKIKNLINDTDRFLKDSRLEANHRSQMLDRLGGALTGLENLEYTYRTEPKTSEQVKLIISQVKTILSFEQQRLLDKSPASPVLALQEATASQQQPLSGEFSVVPQVPLVQAVPIGQQHPVAPASSSPPQHPSPTPTTPVHTSPRASFPPPALANPYSPPVVHRPKVIPLPSVSPKRTSMLPASQPLPEPSPSSINSSSASFEDDNFECSDSYLAPAKDMFDELE